MTDKQRIFCDEYLKDRNASRAYRVAYPNVKNNGTATSAGNRLLRNVHIKKYIDKQLKKLSDSQIATVEEIYKYLTRVVRGESKGCEMAVVSKGGGVSETELRYKPPSEKEQLEAAKTLVKLLPTMSDNIEQQLKIKKLELEIAKLTEEPSEESTNNFIEALSGEAGEVWE